MPNRRVRGGYNANTSVTCYVHFEVVYWSEERANRITNAKVSDRLLGVTAVKEFPQE